MKKELAQLLNISLLLISSTMAYSQVTIGSDTPPEAGAILQLKDDGTYSNGVTAKKGLGLPRVALQDLKKLKMGPTAPDLTATGADAHTGLLVYNVSICAPDPVPLGLYVWNGTEWEYVGATSPDVAFFDDNRPQKLGTQTYPYRTFGAAGTWMLENMRYIPNDNSITLNLNTQSNSTNKYYLYPRQETVETIPSTWDKAQGLLYTYSAATLGAQDNIDMKDSQHVRNTTDSPEANEIEYTGPLGTAPNKYVEGVCPPGWHIPSFREWNVLEREIYNNPQKYSYYTETDTKDITKWNPASWDSDWNKISNGSLGSSGNSGHALAMLSACPLPNELTPTEGKSLPTKQGGFDVLLVGYGGGTYINTKGYGSMAYLWSSSMGSSNAAYARFFYKGRPQITMGSYVKYSYLSVRCKKN